MTKWLQAFLRWFSPGPPQAPSESESTEHVPPEGRSPQSAESRRQPERPHKPLPAGIRIRREKVRVQVGFDFGTSTTKVAYQRIGAGLRQVKALLFNHRLSHYPEFCIPSVAAFDKRGNLVVGQDAARFLSDEPAGEGLRFLKLVLAGQYDKSFLDPRVTEKFYDYLHRWSPSSTNIGVEHVVISFLALTIQEIKLALTRQFPNEELELAFNVCAPIDHIQNNPLKSVFQRILLATELLESYGSSNGNNLLEKSCVAYESADEKKTSEFTKKLFFVPESVGAIASYLASLQVKNGIHAVYDFGAGTTDVSIFEISNVGRGTPFTYWRSARNLPRGSQRIESLIAGVLNSQNQSGFLSDVDVSKAMLALSNQPKSLQEQVRYELRQLWEDSQIGWREAYGRLRAESEWQKEKVQVFVCGGASRLPFIKEIFAESWMAGWGPYSIRDLPGPDVYESSNAKAPFGRLCVAYGLTTPQPELGEYILPRDCPDHTPKKRIRAPTPIYGVDEPDT